MSIKTGTDTIPRTHSYFKERKVHELDKEDYDLLKASGMFYVFYPQACGIWEEDRLNKDTFSDYMGVSQDAQGQDYKIQDNPDGVGWPYEMGDDYISKVTNVTEPKSSDNAVTQEHFDEFVGDLNKNECSHNMVYKGHDHNYDVFKCYKCGYEEER